MAKNRFKSDIDYRKDPAWADWPYWDKYGNPQPDPKELEALLANACPPIDDLAAYMEQRSAEALKRRENGQT
jgi:hypothetical protein